MALEVISVWYPDNQTFTWKINSYSVTVWWCQLTTHNSKLWSCDEVGVYYVKAFFSLQLSAQQIQSTL